MKMRPTLSFYIVGGIAALAAAAYPAVWAAEAAEAQSKKVAADMTGGDPDRGAAAIDAYGCASCHTIPGVRGAKARVGPPLDYMGTRAYIGGVLANQPDNMVRWIQNPRAVDPLTAMPNLDVKESDARDIAAYLYTLR
jgi:cytochrome c2